MFWRRLFSYTKS